MAQAARLSLRLQKELKLLLTDPPPGASFPFIAADSDLSSLSSIDAQVEGPEGTVYAKGIFKIKIQIPERYPFQPPIVTFATPIYHPNIDNGGRICLDILNLPPKGAWRPSLNISTVLTSIGLLLSEPNPDDGLMCEASREYKYNRQVFDQKARSMTEKFAKAYGGGNGCSSQCIETNSNQSTMDVQGVDEGSKHEANELVFGHEKRGQISRKLSLEYSSPTKKGGSREVNEVPNHQLLPSDSEIQMEIKRKRKEVNSMKNKCHLNNMKFRGTRRKLSLESSPGFEKRDDDNKENMDPNQYPSLSPLQAISGASSGSLVLQARNNHDEQPQQQQGIRSRHSSINVASKLHHTTHGQPLRSPVSCQIHDDNNQKMLVSFQSLSSTSCSMTFNELSLSPKLLSVNHTVQTQVDSIDELDVPTDSKSKKHSLVSKKLSLGLKGSSQGQREVNKENVMPINKLPLPKPTGTFRMAAFDGSKFAVSLTQLQTKNDGEPENSVGTSKPFPVPQDYRQSEKQLPNPDKDMETDGEVKQHGTEETTESPISETVIVLDSEDSEEEDRDSSRIRLSPQQKRLGKWRTNAGNLH